MHPVDENGKIIFGDYDYVDTWKAMEKVYEKGLARNIGVSNFNEEQLERILEHGKIKPVVNQVECQPLFNQKKLSDYCRSKGIAITAYRPLGGPIRKLQEDTRIINIAKKYNKTAAQVLLRFQVISFSCTYGDLTYIKKKMMSHRFNLDTLPSRSQ